jgi:transposase
MKGWHFTPAQRKALQRELTRTHDAGVFRRSLALLEADQGRSIAEVARLVRVTRPSIYRWLRRFAAGCAVAALEDRRSQRRPANWNEDLTGLVESALAQSPLQLGYPAANTWTVPLLQAFLEVYLPEQKVSISTLRRCMKDLGYVWKRWRYVLTPDPEEEKKTPDFAPNPGFAHRHRTPGARRNGPVALSTLACRLGAARASRHRAYLRV